MNQVSFDEDADSNISKHIGVDVFVSKSRISSQRRSSIRTIKIGVFKKFAIVTESPLSQSLFFDKVSFSQSFFFYLFYGTLTND